MVTLTDINAVDIIFEMTQFNSNTNYNLKNKVESTPFKQSTA